MAGLHDMEAISRKSMVMSRTLLPMLAAAAAASHPA
jgi:hypothetical protein